MRFGKTHMGWILITAHRLILSRRRSRSSITAILSALGLAAGIMTLTTVISVMNGFQLSTIEDLIEINSFHLRISPPFPDKPEHIEAISGIRSAFTIIETQALLAGGLNNSQVVVLKAVDPDFLENNKSFIQGLGISEAGILKDNSIILGRELSRFLGVRTGDMITAIGFGGDQVSLNNPVEIQLEVSGLFESGYYEFDRNWAFVSLHTAETDFRAGYRKEIAIKIDERRQDITIMRELLRNYPLLDAQQVTSWREYNRSIFGALRVEKTLMAFLVGLIFFVVGVNIFQGLRWTVHEHLEYIAVLKVLGATEKEVRAVFVLDGVIIALIGTSIGLPGGLLISTNINSIFKFIESALNIIQRSGNVQIFSPKYFYLLEVPVHIIPGEIVAIILFASASAIFSAIAASKKIISLNPREILNNE